MSHAIGRLGGLLRRAYLGGFGIIVVLFRCGFLCTSASLNYCVSERMAIDGERAGGCSLLASM